MYKRRNWLLERGADGGDSSSDDSSDEEPQSDVEESESESGSAEESGSDAEGGEDQQPEDYFGGRLEDLSEGDFTDNEDDEVRKEELEKQLEQWTNAKKKQVIKGKAVKCLVCNGTLILNNAAFKEHLGSKKHKKNLDKVEDGDDLELAEAFCFAEDFGGDSEEDEEAETHMERLERIKGLLAKENERHGDGGDDDAAKPESKSSKKKEKKREKKEKPRKRPGKRQRAAEKEERVKTGKERAPKVKKTKATKAT